MVSNILLTPLSSITVEGGAVKHFLKSNESSFLGFGEAYFSFVEFGKIKGWKIHTKMTMNLVVPFGNVGFVFYDQLNDSFKEYVIGDKNYMRLTVPPNIWFGFKGMNLGTNLVANIGNIVHDPSETKKLPISHFSYNWSNL